jgi:hypothetical protein
MIKSHTPVSYAELDALVNSARVVRSQTIAGLIKSAVSAASRRFSQQVEKSCSSLTVSLYY